MHEFLKIQLETDLLKSSFWINFTYLYTLINNISHEMN